MTSSKDQIYFISKEDIQQHKNDSRPEEAAAYNPETKEINWDCPCLGGMAVGPCGEEFKRAFSCFVYSEAEPKGSECIENFQQMQKCFQNYPEYYADQLKEDEETRPELKQHQQEAEVNNLNRTEIGTEKVESKVVIFVDFDVSLNPCLNTSTLQPLSIASDLMIASTSYFNISLNSFDNSSLKYLSLYTESQYSDVVDAANLNEERFSFPSVNLVKFNNSLSFNTVVQDFGLYDVVVWASCNNSSVRVKGTLYYVLNGSSNLTMSELNIFCTVMYLFGFYFITFISYSLRIQNRFMWNFPIPWGMFFVLVFNLCYFGLLYLYYGFKEETSQDYSLIMLLANLCNLTSIGIFYFVSSGICLGWTVIEATLPGRELFSLTGVIWLFLLLAIVQVFTENSFGIALLQLGMEFFRIILAFVLNISAYATTVKLRQRTAASDALVDKIGALNFINTYHKYHSLLKLRNLIPGLIIWPTATLFFSLTLTDTVQQWFHIFISESVTLIGYILICLYIYPTQYNISGTKLHLAKEHNASTTPQEIFTTQFFIYPRWTLSTDFHLWIAFARHIDQVRTNALREIERLTSRAVVPSQ